MHSNIDHVKDLISNDTMWIEGKGTNATRCRTTCVSSGSPTTRAGAEDGNGCVECSSELVFHKPSKLGGRKVRCKCARCTKLGATMRR